LLNSRSDIHFFFIIPVLQKTVECRASEEMNLLECLLLLSRILQEEGISIAFSEENVVHELSTGRRCSLDIPLHSLRVVPYMMFLIS